LANPLGGKLRADVIYPTGNGYMVWFGLNQLPGIWINNSNAVINWYLA